MNAHQAQQLFLASMRLRDDRAVRRRSAIRIDQTLTAAANAVGAVPVLEDIPAGLAQRIADDVNFDLARISIGAQS